MQAFSFSIKLKNKYKSFDTFYIRFTAAITPLGYIDKYKIWDLKKYILADLRI